MMRADPRRDPTWWCDGYRLHVMSDVNVIIMLHHPIEKNFILIPSRYCNSVVFIFPTCFPCSPSIVGRRESSSFWSIPSTVLVFLVLTNLQMLFGKSRTSRLRENMHDCRVELAPTSMFIWIPKSISPSQHDVVCTLSWALWRMRIRWIFRFPCFQSGLQQLAVFSPRMRSIAREFAMWWICWKLSLLDLHLLLVLPSFSTVVIWIVGTLCEW